MTFEIRQVNTRYKDNAVYSVQAVYTARNNSRSVTINGNFELTAEEYEGNESISKLENMAKEHLLEEVTGKDGE